MSRWILAALALSMFIAPAVRGSEIELDGQVRVRAEGADRTHSDSLMIWDILQRTRLGLRATVSEEVQLYVQVQDSRVYGSERTTLTSTINVDLHQGWAEVTKPWGQAEARVRVGRQELSYGNERIVGAVGWHNVGRAFDGGRARVTRGHWNFDVGAWRLAETRVTPTPNDALFMTYNTYTFAGGDRRGELYALYRDDDRGFYETTLGEHANGTLGAVRFDHEFAARLGKRLGEDLEAYLFSAQAHVRVADYAEFGAGFDFLSGDKTPGDGRFTYFNPGRLFHTGHKFYGRMDSALILAGPAGLLDPYARVGLVGPRSLRAEVVVHTFFTHHPFTQPMLPEPSTDELYLGTEVDGSLSFAVASRTRLELGGAVLVPGGSLKDRDLDKTAVWAYAQGIASF